MRFLRLVVALLAVPVFAQSWNYGTVLKTDASKIQLPK
jgi:hypothetical protein